MLSFTPGLHLNQMGLVQLFPRRFTIYFRLHISWESVLWKTKGKAWASHWMRVQILYHNHLFAERPRLCFTLITLQKRLREFKFLLFFLLLFFIIVNLCGCQLLFTVFEWYGISWSVIQVSVISGASFPGMALVNRANVGQSQILIVNRTTLRRRQVHIFKFPLKAQDVRPLRTFDYPNDSIWL
jgi:hypothetical protein